MSVAQVENADQLKSWEENRLTFNESVIEQGQKTFIEVGNALLEIRDNRYYRQSAPTFEAYLKRRFPEIGRRRAYQLMYAAEVVADVNSCAQTPANESQARPLAPLAPEERREVWQGVVEEAKETGEPITAAKVEAAADQFRQPEPKVIHPAKPVQIHTETILEPAPPVAPAVPKPNIPVSIRIEIVTADEDTYDSVEEVVALKLYDLCARINYDLRIQWVERTPEHTSADLVLCRECGYPTSDSELSGNVCMCAEVAARQAAATVRKPEIGDCYLTPAGIEIALTRFNAGGEPIVRSSYGEYTMAPDELHKCELLLGNELMRKAVKL